MQAVCTEAFCYPLDLEGFDEEDDSNDDAAHTGPSLGFSTLDSSALKVEIWSRIATLLKAGDWILTNFVLTNVLSRW